MSETPAAPLGPFQEIWDAWDEAGAELAGKPLTHFRRATEIQFDEIDRHLAEDNADAAAREAVDLISVALNTLRRLGYQPDQIAEIARMRARQRMKGQAQEILAKYERQYGI